MADKLENGNWEKIDTDRMTNAVREIRKSENLRYFLRSIFYLTGMSGTPDGATNELTARLVGRHSVGTDIMSAVMKEDPCLYAELLLEDVKEVMDRNGGNYE